MKELPVNFDLDEMQKAMASRSVELPDDIADVDAFDLWLEQFKTEDDVNDWFNQRDSTDYVDIPDHIDTAEQFVEWVRSLPVDKPTQGE